MTFTWNVSDAHIELFKMQIGILCPQLNSQPLFRRSAEKLKNRKASLCPCDRISFLFLSSQRFHEINIKVPTLIYGKEEHMLHETLFPEHQKMYLMLCQVPERETRKAEPKFILLEPTPKKYTHEKSPWYLFNHYHGEISCYWTKPASSTDPNCWSL